VINFHFGEGTKNNFMDKYFFQITTTTTTRTTRTTISFNTVKVFFNPFKEKKTFY